MCAGLFSVGGMSGCVRGEVDTGDVRNARAVFLNPRLRTQLSSSDLHICGLFTRVIDAMGTTRRTPLVLQPRSGKGKRARRTERKLRRHYGNPRGPGAQAVANARLHHHRRRREGRVVLKIYHR
jgi:hypothetical protein